MSSNPFAALEYAGVAGIVLIVIGFIAWIVLTIVLYVKYISKSGDHYSKMGSFLNFDVLVIERLLKFFYILNAVAIAVACVLLPIILAIAGGTAGSYGYRSSGAGAGFLGFFLGLLIAVVAFFILQLFNRVQYEFVIMFVILVQNSTAIRKAIVPGQPAPAPAPQPSYGYAPSGAPAGGHSAPAPSAGAPFNGAPSNVWFCPICGTRVQGGSTCPKCGAARR